MASLTIAVGVDGAEAEPPVPSSAPAAETASVDLPLATQVAAPTRSEALVSTDTPAARSAADLPPVGVPLDPLFRDMQQRFDVLLQTGRTNLGERYLEAVREFEERRQQREELLPPPPPPTDEEVAAWNGAMHNWHDRNPGFAETDLGGNDGTWTMGWGMPGPGERTLDGNPGVGTLLGLGNPNALARLTGAAAAPSLAEGLKDLR